MDLARRLASAEVQRGWPKQSVEVDDVLPDEVDLFHAGVGGELVKALGGTRRLVPVAGGTASIEMVAKRCEISDRCIEPYVEVLARGVRNLDAEIRRVA